MKENNLVKILMVDDRAENLFALEVILSNENYLCVKASSGTEALKILRREQGFALILMDVQMPVMDGFETIKLICQIEKLKHVPIIFLTASMDTSENIFKGYQAGAVDYMIKPFSPEILKAKVAVFVDLYKKTQKLLVQKEQIKKLNRVYTVLSNINQSIICVRNKQTLNDEVCRIAVEDGKFRMTWIGMIVPQTNTVNPVASAGFTDDYLKNIKIDLGDKERSQGPTGRAIKSGIYCLANDIANDPKMIPWREHALRHRYKSSAAFPLKVFGKTIGAITLYSDEQFFFDKSEVKLLDEMAMNISFAIEFNENEIKQKLAEEEIKKLNETLEHKVIERTSQLIAANNELKAFTYSVKLASQYSLSLIEASLDPLVTISPEGKITDMNEAFANITGITRKKLTGSDFFDYFTEQHKAGEVYQEVFAKGSIANSPLTLRHKNGKLTDVLFNGSVYKDDRGNIQGVVIVARDVTVQKRIENELIEAKVFAEIASLIAEKAKSKAESATRIAENAVKAKQQFLSNMSHEIRTPMNAIIGFTKVVLKTDMSAKQKEYLTAIKMSGDTLIVIINDILDLAKVDAGKMTFEKIPFKMALSISAMLHLFETNILEKNLELVKEYDNKIPEVLVGDPMRLHQIILNLVSNAVKFTSKGKITVSVRLISEDEEKVTIEFAVTDTGIGIPENKIGKIFDNFQQATSATSRLFGGTGLGLAIVKQLVEPQGGSISVKSKLDEGSTFSFILSFIKTNTEAILETKIEELNTEIKNIKVLVAEDIPLNQLLMKILLEEFGFEHDIADNGKIAIEKLQNNPYDIILMDLQMPEMNGFEATEYIRNTMNSKIPIIALTADVTTVDLSKCKAVGMNDYISKPVDERLLYSKIIELLKKSVLI